MDIRSNPNHLSKKVPGRLFCVLSGLSGILGVAMLGVSFAINNGPPLGSSPDQFARFVRDSYASILWGAWLQAVGPVFIVIFAFTLVQLAKQGARLAGWMTFFGATVLMAVSLIEITFYISALYPDPSVATPISFEMIHSVQHLYFVVAAPALFLPLGCVLLASRVLPRIFGFLALALGGAFAVVGMASMLTLTLPSAVTALGSLQAVWWFAAAVALVVRSKDISAQDTR
jgi:hypothetical protein